MPRKILVVDDHPQIRRVLRGFVHLQEDCEVCGEAVDGLDANFFRISQAPMNDIAGEEPHGEFLS